MTFTNMPDNQKPRERMEKYGPECLSDTELLEVLISSGTQDCSVIDIASEIIAEINGNLFELANYSKHQFKRKGISDAKSSQLVAAVELGKRIATGNAGNRIDINHPEHIKEHFDAEIRSLHQENLLVLMLNNKRELIKKVTVSIGSVFSANASPREVFANALKCGAGAIIVAHNHPSGDPSPSDADISITKQLFESGKLMEIPLLDHIIVGTEGYFSFRENNML